MSPSKRNGKVKDSHSGIDMNKQIAAVEKVDTKYQRADIMTKALPKDSFQFLRKTITGW